ncbi:MAG: tetratricopeptide repeat protein [Sphingobacteriaceae bacterium]|jgi:tetratricopeptide (TPR) repeat protein|nr:tetratricopeptide repeat protein [Sphingobacteriaceae bacterium]
MKILTPLLVVSILFSNAAIAQKSSSQENPYMLLGRKALMDGDFKLAVAHLEKALPSDSTNANLLYILGYSYYHSSNYPKAVSTFSRVVSLRPGEVSAYYYRGKARNNMATEANTPLSYSEREKLLQASIRDFSKAIELNSDDIKYYQNRGVAYRDLGILKSQRVAKFYDKAVSANAYKACINDFQHVLEANPGRTDMIDELKKVKVYLANL